MHRRDLLRSTRASSSSRASRSPSTARGTPPRLGIEIVYQDLALCDNLDIVQNMFLGREQAAGHRCSTRPRWRSWPARRWPSLSVRTVQSVRQLVASLSGGQRQTVAIAKAVLWNIKVVILDEPTAALGVAQTEQVLDLVRRLADNGLAVVLISPQHERRLRRSPTASPRSTWAGWPPRSRRKRRDPDADRGADHHRP